MRTWSWKIPTKKQKNKSNLVWRLDQSSPFPGLFGMWSCGVAAAHSKSEDEQTERSLDEIITPS